MSNNGRNNDNTTKRCSLDTEQEGSPRTIKTSTINTEASSQFVLRGRPLQRPTYTLRSPSAARSTSRRKFLIFDREMQAAQETAVLSSSGLSQTCDRRPRTPELRTQMTPPLNASPMPAVWAIYNTPPTGLESNDDEDEDEEEPEVVAAPAANTTTQLSATAESRQVAEPSKTASPSVLTNTTPARAPPPTSTPNTATSSPFTPALPTQSTPSPSNTRSPSRSWTADQEAALIESTRHVVEQENGHAYHVFEMWEVIARRVRGVHNVQRTGAACRMWWNRKLRAETGFDERKTPKGNMVTCIQQPHLDTKKRRGREDDEDERSLGRMKFVGR